MVVATLLLSFIFNIINHGSISVAILNTALLLLSILFYLKFTHQNLSIIKSKSFISPILFLIGAIPLFIQKHDFFIILLTIGTCLLLLLYYSARNFKMILASIILLYIVITSFYANGLIKFPFSLQTNQFIFSDDWMNLYISQMQKEALYIPYKIRLLIFNGSIYFNVALSTAAGLFMFKNLYEVLLIANLYPLIKGLILDLKNWDKSKTFLILCILLISFITVSSRTVNIFDAFTLISPFLMYFILRGFSSLNKIIYVFLFALSIVIATSAS